jgi:NAD(P)-dependent dehydrogenase (short-subunit alcohol dehydrogenase family)
VSAPMSSEYDGLVAAVTGGGAGIGLAIAEELAARGATVAALDLDTAGVPDHLLGVHCDVTDRASVDAAVVTVVERLGGLDVVVNNAGISAVGTVEEISDEDWGRVLDVNVVGMARVSAAALPHLRRSGQAAIVNLCSIGALNGLPQRVAYNASKGAVLALTYAMATDHVAEGVRVNCVSPGTVHTGFVDRMLAKFPDPAAEKAALDARQATGRMVTPQEVADAVAYLASPRSGSTTGTALEVDGGVTHLRVRPVQQAVTGAGS